MGNKGERRGGGSDEGYLDLMAAVVTQQVEDAYDNRIPLRKGCAQVERERLGFGGVRASGAAMARNTGILDMENGSLGLVGASWAPSGASRRHSRTLEGLTSGSFSRRLTSPRGR